MARETYYIGFDTANGGLSLALIRLPAGEAVFETLYAFHDYPFRGHAEKLPVLFAEALSENGLSPEELSGMICVTGPGGFSGVRAGAAFANGAAAVSGTPIIGLTSGVALAASVIVSCAGSLSESDMIVTISNARRGEGYYALFNGSGKVLLQDRMLSFSDAVKSLYEAAEKNAGEIFIIGHGRHNLLDMLKAEAPGFKARINTDVTAESADASLFTSYAVQCAFPQEKYIKPFYLREADAVLPKAVKSFL